MGRPYLPDAISRTPEYLRAKSARYVAAHPELKAYRQAYRQAHPEKWAIYTARQKVRRHEARQLFVYMYVSPKGYTAYVGRGHHRRVIAHKSRGKPSPWYEPDMVLHTMPARNEWHAMQLEGEWGERFQPRYNIEGIRHLPNWQDEAELRRIA